MKKMKITAASRPRPIDMLGEVSDVAYNVGYNMEVDDEFNITFDAVRDEKYMPTITVKTEFDDGTYYFIPTLRFPVLKQDDMMYADDIEAYIDRWGEVGNMITLLNRTSINPDDYVDE